MKRFLIIILFIVLYALIGFFGLGPALFADGTMQERLITIAVVALLYVILTYIFMRLLRKSR